MKESRYKEERGLVFRETFLSEQDVRRNGGVPTNLTFSQGKGIYDGTTKYITYPKITTGVYTIIVNLSELILGTTQIVMDFSGLSSSGSGYIYIETNGTIVRSLGTVYIDGVAVSVITTSSKQLIITGISINHIAHKMRIGARADSGALNLNASLDLIEIYKGTWTAQEVANAYRNARYADVQVNHKEQLGAELATGWNTSGYWDTFAANWSVVNGTLVSDGNSGFLIKVPFWTIGKRYRVTASIIRTSGTLNLPYDPAAGALSVTASGEYSYIHIAAGTELRMYSNLFNGTITALSIKEVLVNSTQEILNVSHKGNKYAGDVYEELVTNGGFDSTTGWDRQSSWTIANGKATYDDINNHYLENTGLVVTTGKVYCLRFTVLDLSAGVAKLAFTNQVTGFMFGTNYENYTLGVQTIEFTSLVSSTSLRIYAQNGSGSAFSIDNVSLKELIPEPINTAITLFKDGEVLAPKFNGSTSRIAIGSYDTLIGDLTFLAIVKTYGFGGSDFGALIDATGFGVRIPTSLKLQITSNNFATSYLISDNSIKLNGWQFIAITRTAAGITNTYIGAILTGAADQSTGTPTASSTIYEGNNASGTRGYDGLIEPIRIVKGLMTVREISQWVTSSKQQYNL